MTCPHCGAPAQVHSIDQCRDNLKQQRDEARATAREILHEPYGDTHWERVDYSETEHDWLKQPTVDEPCLAAEEELKPPAKDSTE